VRSITANSNWEVERLRRSELRNLEPCLAPPDVSLCDNFAENSRQLRVHCEDTYILRRLKDADRKGGHVA
jgi:hypothetical protein